jgi:HSP20 family protein
MEDFFNGFFSNDYNLPEAAWSKSFAPAFDISETENDIRVKAELPGMDPENIDVNLAGNILTVKGEKKEEQEEKGENRHRVERRFGAFTRSFRLPAQVDSDKVDASYKEGVLSLTIPKTESAKKKSIKVEVK